MSLPAETQFKFWGMAAVIAFVLLWVLGDVLVPFVLGGAIAYILDPMADWLEERGLSRGLAVLLISVGFLLVFVAVSLVVIPTLVQQSIDLVNAVPQLLQELREFISERAPGGVAEGSPFADTLGSIGETVRDRGLEVLNGLLSSAMSVIGVLMLLFIVPVVAVYLLIDWDKLVAQVDDLLPREHTPTIRRLAREIDRTLSGFIRGQGTVCIIQGSFYAMALMLAGLNFGLVVGVVAGLLSFIPLVGSITGGILAIGLAVFQFWGEWLQIALVAAIFMFGQIVEGNYLTPKLVGNSVGLHPVWLLLALSVFGTLFGFIGMLMAVPLAAMLGVIVRFGVHEYKTGELYRGIEDRDDHQPAPRDDDAVAE